jgi:thiol:disulfide interchange protein DsbD
MKLFRFICAAVMLFAVSAASAQEEVVHWQAPKVSHVQGDVYRMTITCTMDAGWHIYDLGPYEFGPIPTSFAFTPGKGLEMVGSVKLLNAPKKVMDEVWGFEVGDMSNKATFTQDVRLKADKATLNGIVEWQSCTSGENAMCLPPMEHEFAVEVVKVKETAAAASTEAVVAPAPEEPAVEEPVVEEPVVEEPVVEEAPVIQPAEAAEGGRSLWTDILAAMGWGLVALLTPCVFPMVPVTVAFFLKGSENKATARFKATMFGLFIVTLFTLPIALIVITAQLTGGAGGAAGMFTWLATNWIPNLIFFIIFMIFAASFFGAFEIVVPSSLINKSDSKADKKGLVGVFFMALTLVLISFSCTAPIVGFVVVDAAQSSTAWWQPIITMLVYSAVFAIPFTLLAFAPSLMDKLKSGSWMNSVKVSLGFVEVALAFKFIMIIDMTYGLNLLSREMCLAIWIMCGLLWTLYLLGVFKTKHDSPLEHVGPVRLAFAMVVLTFTLWMVPGMWGAPLKSLSGYMPPMTAQNFKVLTSEDLAGLSLGSAREPAIRLVDGKNPVTGEIPKYSDVEKIHAPEGFNAFFDVDEAMAYARSVNKPVFIDITGAACVNCREMEQNVWTDPAVKSMLLYDYVMVCVYLDVKFDLPEKDWVTDENGKVLKRLNNVNMAWSQKNYGTVAQPLYVIVDPRDGAPLGPTRAYNRSIPEYTAWLKTGLENYAAK